MLLWVDLETTGLKPESDTILEVALVVTDNELNEVEATSWVCHYTGGTDGVNPIVVKMHAENGLWEETKTGSPFADVELGLYAMMRKYTEPKTTPICGSTVSFDRAFLRQHMSEVEAHFSHRHIDVSVIGELALRWHPDVWEGRPKQKAGTHRALPDIRHSIELLKYYRERFLR